MEIWKEIPDTNGRYLASDLGRIKSVMNGVLSPTKKPSGYLYVTIKINGVFTKCHVHRLVLLVFKGKSDLVCNHIDFNKENNALANLEYMEHRSNLDWSCFHGRIWQVGELNKTNKLTKDQALTVKKLINQGERNCNIAKQFNVNVGVIERVKYGQTWQHLK